ILARLRHETFFSLAALNARIAELLADLNARLTRLYRASRRELFERLDQPALRPLPAEAFVYSDWKVGARVSLDYHLELHGHYYSVPYALIHEHVDARLTATTVEIFHRGHGRRRASSTGPAPSAPRPPRWSRRFSRTGRIPSRGIARASDSCGWPRATVPIGSKPPAPAPSRSGRAPIATSTRCSSTASTASPDRRGHRSSPPPLSTNL